MNDKRIIHIWLVALEGIAFWHTIFMSQLFLAAPSQSHCWVQTCCMPSSVISPKTGRIHGPSANCFSCEVFRET